MLPLHLLLIASAVLSVPAVAHSQEAGATAVAKRKLHLELSPILALPHGNRWTEIAHASPGVAAAAGYDLTRFLSGHVGLRTYAPREDDNQIDGSISLWDVSFTGRGRLQLGDAELDGEIGYVIQHSEVSTVLGSRSENENGSLLAVGATYYLTPSVGARASIQYVSTFDDFVSAGWLDLGAGLHVRL